MTKKPKKESKQQLQARTPAQVLPRFRPPPAPSLGLGAGAGAGAGAGSGADNPNVGRSPVVTGFAGTHLPAYLFTYLPFYLDGTHLPAYLFSSLPFYLFT